MTITITDYTMPCGTGTHCRHRICEDCGDPMRSAHHKITDHPGTRQIATKNRCHRCQKKYRNYDGGSVLTPDDLEDQRHILLSDAEMDRMQTEQPNQYAWHLNRRWGMYEREMKRIRDNNETISAEKFELLAALTSRPKPRNTNGFGSTGQ